MRRERRPHDRDDPAYLRDMLDACERIGRFVRGKSLDGSAFLISQSTPESLDRSHNVMA